MTKFLNISTDNTLGGNSPSDVAVSSQKAVKEYVDSQTGTAPAFANITGQPTDNANLASALNAKYDASNPNGFTSNVGTVTSVNNTSPDSGGNVTISIPTVDQTYSASSTNAQSGTAVASAISGKADDSDVVHKTGNETINGTKTFNDTLQLKSNLSFRSYGSNDSGRLQFRAQPSDNVIRGTVAITDGYSTSGSGYNGYVAQMVSRAGSTSSDPFNTMRVSNKGIEYIKEANDGTITGQYTLIDDTGIVPDARLSSNIARTSQIPTVNNATLTIQKNGATVKTFTANASTDVTANIIVPTKVSDLTNDSGFISGITSSDVTTALGYTPYNSTNPSGYQANVIETVKVNNTALTPSGKAVNITVPTKVSDLTNDSGFISGITSSDVTTALGYTPIQYAMVITDYTA